jgi:hypothetical protein
MVFLTQIYGLSHNKRSAPIFFTALGPQSALLYYFDQVFINFGFFDVRGDRKFSFRIMAIFARIKKSWMLRVTEHLVEIAQYPLTGFHWFPLVSTGRRWMSARFLNIKDRMQYNHSINVQISFGKHRLITYSIIATLVQVLNQHRTAEFDLASGGSLLLAVYEATAHTNGLRTSNPRAVSQFRCHQFINSSMTVPSFPSACCSSFSTPPRTTMNYQ